jgi:SAM-dependent methyltransferase
MNRSRRPPYKRSSPGYAYYQASDDRHVVRNRLGAEELSRALLNPGLREPNFLVLRERRMLFSQFVQSLPKRGLAVLDIGGRLQPFRPLIEDRLGLYVAVDPVLEGLLDVVAVGESLPFPDKRFDLAICTQVLLYVADPRGVLAEIHRVLKEGGYLFLSTPSIFPRYFDTRWCFMPDGLSTLLAPFSQYTITPEDGSIGGLLRSFNLFLDTFIRSERLKRLTSYTVYPLTNLLGLLLDRFSRERTEFSTNYTSIARK